MPGRDRRGRTVRRRRVPLLPEQDDTIAEIADGYAGDLRAVFEELSAGPDTRLGDVMERAVGIIDGQAGPDGMMRLAVQVWAEALRDEPSAGSPGASTAASGTASWSSPSGVSGPASCPPMPIPRRSAPRCSRWSSGTGCSAC
jgi:hypothetical protein